MVCPHNRTAVLKGLNGGFRRGFIASSEIVRVGAGGAFRPFVRRTSIICTCSMCGAVWSASESQTCLRRLPLSQTTNC